MYVFLSDETGIRQSQKRFEEYLKQSAKEFERIVGHHGGSKLTTVFWRSDLRIWGAFELRADEPIPRYWNVFGVQDPRDSRSLDIAVEINPPLSGTTRMTGGAFAMDTRTKEVIVVHRGKIGGGKWGIGKQLFQDNYRGKWILVSDPNDPYRDDKVVEIASLGSPDFAQRMSEFVHEVDRIKKQLRPARTF